MKQTRSRLVESRVERAGLKNCRLQLKAAAALVSMASMPSSRQEVLVLLLPLVGGHFKQLKDIFLSMTLGADVFLPPHQSAVFAASFGLLVMDPSWSMISKYSSEAKRLDCV